MTHRNHPVDVAFFKRYGGFSYDPKTETKAQGKLRCARKLAAAEAWAHECWFHCVWEIDPEITSADWINRGEDGGPDCNPWETYCCTLYGMQGQVLAHLGGVDFGRNGSPDSDPYKRVVEAELALEARAEMSELAAA